MNESRRDSELRYLDENEAVGWFDARCFAIAEGRPPEHCWKDYCLRRRTFIAWLRGKPERVKALADAMAAAQLQKLLRLDSERQVRRELNSRLSQGEHKTGNGSETI